MSTTKPPSKRSQTAPRRRASMREVADRAGVAMSSVSRVLSGHPDVSEQMRENVIRAVEELGYVPDMLAQGLRTQRTMSVGFTISDISNPVLAETITGAERRLRTAGYSLLLTDAESDPERDAADIRLLQQRRVDGMLASVADEQHAGTKAALQEVEVPVVLIDRDRPQGVVGPRVCFEHQSGMRAAAEHLFALGHRHVALIAGGPRRPTRQRRKGVEAVFQRKGANTSCRVYEQGLTIEHGVEATRAILALEARPTAVIAAGNQLMHGALRTLHAAGVRIGEEISFVGCDDVAVAEFHDPPIALVRRDTREIGRVAAGLLIDAMSAEPDSDDAYPDLVLPTEFVARASAAPPPGAPKRRRRA